jgi:hypothetical protein
MWPPPYILLACVLMVTILLRSHTIVTFESNGHTLTLCSSLTARPFLGSSGTLTLFPSSCFLASLHRR